MGPTIGGLLINQFGWRSIFAVVVPLGIVAFSLAMPSIPESSDSLGRHFDIPGQVLGALALGGVSFAAIESDGAAGVATVALAIAALSLASFIKVEAREGQVRWSRWICSLRASFGVP
jgi:hypothetical protein